MSGGGDRIRDGDTPVLTGTPHENSAFPAADESDFHDLVGGRAYYQAQQMTIDQYVAAQNYISQDTEPGSFYSMSQNLNNAMANGIPLTANQAYVRDELMGAMHNLGQNLNLTRYDHDTFLNRLLSEAGIEGDYAALSESQLKDALIGHVYRENRFVSVSHNDFSRSLNRSLFASRAVKIRVKARAGTQAMMPGRYAGNTSGSRSPDDQGELVLAPSDGNRNVYRITDVRITNTMARRQGTNYFSTHQVELTVLV